MRAYFPLHVRDKYDRIQSADGASAYGSVRRYLNVARFESFGRATAR
ncbi:MAG: hypothetical protein QOH76_130 [Thermoleophilaceae bacterium]|jgi:hypothetical protein|nr:hypothetical protein [Thermoleophilaceae bacterium]